MAKSVQVQMVDDLDGGIASDEITFALDGVSYEIDLGADNAAELRNAFAPYLAHGRRIGGRSSVAKSRRSTAGSNGDMAAVRVWARENGFEVGVRGKVPANIVDAYNARG